RQRLRIRQPLWSEPLRPYVGGPAVRVQLQYARLATGTAIVEQRAGYQEAESGADDARRRTGRRLYGERSSLQQRLARPPRKIRHGNRNARRRQQTDNRI